MEVFNFFLIILTVSSLGETYKNNEVSKRIHQKLEDLIEKTLEDEIDHFSPNVEDNQTNDDENSEEDQELDEFTEQQDPWRRVRIRGSRIIREVTRPIRRIVPTRSIRFRKVPPPNPPPRPAQCRAPNNACPSSWNVFDDYDILEMFTNACGKYSICNTCASNRKWSLGSCVNRFLGDLKNLCKPFSNTKNYPAGYYDVCVQQAAKFFTLAKNSQRSVSSPAWCSDPCVAQRGGPNVEIQA